ncbi:MAG: hypothetical protein KAH20_12555 [Methylococcales bacterium]|nr:hypothetical protein [Methylococcales bacterium]
MAFEYLDLENKLFIPTQTLWTKLQVELINLVTKVRQFLIEVHDTVAALGVEWYDSPILTTTKWYDHSVILGNELYVKVTDEFWPQAEIQYDEILVATHESGSKILNTYYYFKENPEQVSIDSIEFLTESLVKVGNISAELTAELQTKGAEIVSLLLEQPLQTFELACKEILTALLNGYFEIVSNILIS